jgi:hypothetical protein
MTTMLEKMARAIYPRVASAADFNAMGFDDFDTAVKEGGKRGNPWVEESYAIARDALEAINERMVVAGVWCGSDGKTVFPDRAEEAMRLAWKDMIDVILSERA